MEIILILSLIVVLVIIVLSFIFNAYKTPGQLKSRSIVIIDSRGQHVVSQTEFTRFMSQLESIFSDSRNQDPVSTGLVPREKEKYIDKSSEELKRWIRNNNNYPWVTTPKDPMDEEIEGMKGENNPLMFDKCSGSYDGPHLNKEDGNATLNDIANYIKQIKEINLQMTDDERKSIDMSSTHKLLVKLLKQYYHAASVENINYKSITDAVESVTTSIPKMKKNRDNTTLNFNNGNRDNVIVEIDQISSNDSDRNSAIETMLVSKKHSQPRLSGGRKHILL